MYAGGRHEMCVKFGGIAALLAKHIVCVSVSAHLVEIYRSEFVAPPGILCASSSWKSN